MPNLRIKLKKKGNPYKEESSALLELWGEIVIYCEEKVILNLEWDVSSFVEWFGDKKGYLKTEKFPFVFTNSIAESRDVLLDKIDDFSDLKEQFAYEDYLSEYFMNHHFHLRGTTTPAFYIGLSPENYGEISYFEDGKYYSYSFDMNEFLENTDKEIKQYLSTIVVNIENKEYFKDILGEYYSNVRFNK